MHGNIFKDGSRNSAPFKMELFPTIGNGRAYNQWTVVFACCCGNFTIFTGIIKIGLKCSCLEDSIRYLQTCFCIFSKMPISVSLTSCFISKINYKNKNWFHCQFHLPGFYEQKQPSTHVLKNVNKNAGKTDAKEFFLIKLRTEVNLF